MQREVERIGTPKQPAHQAEMATATGLINQEVTFIPKEEQSVDFSTG